MLKSKNSGFFIIKRNGYAKELKIDVPQVLFQGMLCPHSFEKSIKNEDLLKEYNVRKYSLAWDDPEELIQQIKTIRYIFNITSSLKYLVIFNF